MDDLRYMDKLRTPDPESGNNSVESSDPEAYSSSRTRVPRRGAIINEITSMTYERSAGR